MKKTVGICLFFLIALAVFLITIFAASAWKKEETLMPPASETIIAETESSVTQTPEAAESLAYKEPGTYKIGVEDGVLVVYINDGATLYFETNIRTRELDDTVLSKIENGLYFSDEQELYAFLESYSS